MIAVIGKEFVAESVEAGWDGMPSKVSCSLREMNDAQQRGFSKLRVHEFRALVRLRWNTVSQPKLTAKCGVIEREPIPRCVQIVTDLLGNCTVCQRSDALDPAALPGAQRAKHQQHGNHSQRRVMLFQFVSYSLSSECPYERTALAVKVP